MIDVSPDNVRRFPLTIKNGGVGLLSGGVCIVDTRYPKHSNLDIKFLNGNPVDRRTSNTGTKDVLVSALTGSPESLGEGEGEREREN